MSERMSIVFTDDDGVDHVIADATRSKYGTLRLRKLRDFAYEQHYGFGPVDNYKVMMDAIAPVETFINHLGRQVLGVKEYINKCEELGMRPSIKGLREIMELAR